jgi:RNA polymerase sigma-70 factor (ECF subfamily)
MRQEPEIADAEDRLTSILDRYEEFLKRQIARLCPRRLGVESDDILQEARLRLWNALVGGREIADPASYLYRVAVSVTIDAVRRVTARREEQLADEQEQAAAGASLPAPSPSPEQEALHREILAKADHALRRLSSNRSLAVRLHLQGFRIEEIARLLDWSEAKTRKLVYRGLRDLRDALRSEGIELETES